eukprot:2564823-Pyramimonas_sp.AAC.1
MGPSSSRLGGFLGRRRAVSPGSILGRLSCCEGPGSKYAKHARLPEGVGRGVPLGALSGVVLERHLGRLRSFWRRSRRLAGRPRLLEAVLSRLDDGGSAVE